MNQHVGQQRRQDQRLVRRVVEVRLEIDRIAVDVAEELRRDLRQSRLGVAHLRRRVAIDRAEVALPVDQRVAHGEVLGHAHQGVVDGAVAVRVELAHHVADRAGGLAIARGRADAELLHPVEDAALDGLEAVPHVRQGARDDDGHGVVEVGLAHLVFDANGLDAVRSLLDHGHLSEWPLWVVQQGPRGALEGGSSGVDPG